MNKNQFTDLQHGSLWKTILKWGILVVLPLVVYFFILINRITFLRPISLATRFSFTLVVPVLLLVFWMGFGLKGWPGHLVSLTIVLGVFAFSLAGIWASGQSDALIMTGLLPISDAHGYYLDASRLLENQPYSEFSSRRPFFAGLLAVLLKLTGRNLQLTVSLLVLITAVSCYLAARAVRRSHGPIAASVFLLILFLFYRRFAGTTMTENLGLSLGSLGFALLWRSPGDKKLWYAILGIGALSLGLIARAGPFFILPGVILWTAWFYRENKKFSLLVAGTGLLVIALSFGLNYLMFRALGNQNGVLFTNFSYSFYGLATGGQRWDAIYQEHPEVFLLSETQQPGAIYDLAFDQIKQNPLKIVNGALKQYYYLVSNTWYNAYGYAGAENDFISWTAQYTLIGLSLAALVLGWKRKKDPHVLLTFLMFAGVLVSVPFVPPGDTNRMRAYATVIPIFAIMPALGLMSIIQKTPWVHLSVPVQDSDVFDLSPIVTFILIGLITIAPLMVRWSSQPSVYQQITCEGDVEAAYIYYTPDSFIRVQKESDFFLDWLPDYHQGRYQKYIHSMPYMDLVAEFAQVNAPMTILTTNDLKTGRGMWVLADSQLLPSQFGILGLCGNYRQSQTGQIDGFFDVKSVQLLETEANIILPWKGF